jgi:hypothetical protein
MNSARITSFCFLLLAASLAVSAQSLKYTLQVSAAPTQAEAEKQVSQLKAQHLDAYWIRSQVPGVGVRYRVRIGRFPTKAVAHTYGERLRQQGLIIEFFIADFIEPPPNVAAAELQTPGSSSKPAPASQPKEAAYQPMESPAAPKSAAPAVPPAPGYARFEDQTIGYSFEHPIHWTGGAFGNEEVQARRIDAGAVFQSPADAAFLNSVWNALEEANSPTHDNDLLVSIIIKNMGSGPNTQSLTETARRMTVDNGQIKTVVELRAVFRDPARAVPLNFLGKTVIIRTRQGILHLAVFYAPNGPPQMAHITDHIIQSLRAPE